jgi:hypothetical protein
LSRELYFSLDLFILANKLKKLCLFSSITTSRGTPVEKPWCRERFVAHMWFRDWKLTDLIPFDDVRGAGLAQAV